MFVGAVALSAWIVACDSSGNAVPTDAGPGDASLDAAAEAAVIPTMVPCTTGGGECRLPEECGRGVGAIGSSKYNCGGTRRLCCFTSCGSQPEDFECCNAAHTYAPRPLCQDGAFSCSAGFSQVPIGKCIADAAAPVLDSSLPFDADVGDANGPDAADAADGAVAEGGDADAGAATDADAAD